MRLSTNEGKRRKRLSPAQGQALAEQWRGSGETVAAFCRRQEGVAVQTLRYWIGRSDKPGKSTKKPGDFFVVSAPATPPGEQRSAPSRPSTEQYEQQLRNAVIVVLPVATTGGLAQTVQALLREVGT